MFIKNKKVTPTVEMRAICFFIKKKKEKRKRGNQTLLPFLVGIHLTSVLNFQETYIKPCVFILKHSPLSDPTETNPILHTLLIKY